MEESQEVMAAGRYLRMIRQGHWEYVDRHNTSGAVAVVAVTDEAEIVLVEQHRIPMGGPCIELPAGLAGDGDDPEEDFALAARRELLEETGYEAKTMTHLMRVCTSPGLTSETIDLFRAEGVRRVGEGGGVASEHEDITTHLVSIAEADAWLAERGAAGAMVDVKVLTAVALAKQWGA